MLEMRLENREPFIVWGYSVETDLENNDRLYPFGLLRMPHSQ